MRRTVKCEDCPTTIVSRSGKLWDIIDAGFDLVIVHGKIRYYCPPCFTKIEGKTTRVEFKIVKKEEIKI